MPEYDAFGREIGEEPAAVARPAPAAPAAARPAAVARAAPFFVRRRRPRVVSRLLVLAIVIGGLGALVSVGGRALEDAIEDVPGVSGGPDGTPAESARPPAGLQRGSLVRPGELRRALHRLRAERLGPVTNLRLAPERIDAQLLSGGRIHSVQLRHDGELQRFSTSGPGFGHLGTIPFARLDPTAPARLLRAAAARLHRPVTRIDYLVASEFDGKVTWGAYFKRGQIFQGDARGRLLRRVS